MRGRIRPRATVRGFTLVELLVVVVIMSILSVIGVTSFRKYVYGSKPADALAMIQSIRAAEERWKADNLMYLNVTQTTNWYPVLPGTDPATSGHNSSVLTKHAFYNTGVCGVPLPDTDDCRWKLLNPTIPGPTEFSFMVTAGPPSQAMTEPDSLAKPTGWGGWPVNTEHWYVIQAIADANGDQVYSKFLASSVRADVYHENDGE